MISRSRFVMPIVTAIVLGATFSYAALIFAINLPPSDLKVALSPIVHRLSGPYVWQGWSLFAPDVANTNLRVLVRGRSDDGKTTPWYDASLFFLDRNAAAGLGVDRISEGLFHGAQELALRQDTNAKVEEVTVVERTSAMILRAYAGARPSKMQVQIDLRDVPAVADRRKIKPLIAFSLPWRRIPVVAAI